MGRWLDNGLLAECMVWVLLRNHFFFELDEECNGQSFLGFRSCGLFSQLLFVAAGGCG
jgi:hypothetical protein